MPHKCGEKYLLECVKNGWYSVYEKCIQLSPIRYMVVPEGCLDLNKKLLVLSLNGVLCDCPNHNEKFSPDLAKPHLHTFLELVYKHYNIFIWSSDSMRELLRKADILRIRGSTRYTISAYLDNTFMQTVVSSHFIHPKKVKNLEVIFKKIDFFDSTNTIMVANEPWSLIKNPKNGFLFETDSGNGRDVLLTLALFLEKITWEFSNFAEIPHLEQYWQMVVQTCRVDD